MQTNEFDILKDIDMSSYKEDVSINTQSNKQETTSLFLEKEKTETQENKTSDDYLINESDINNNIANTQEQSEHAIVEVNLKQEKKSFTILQNIVFLLKYFSTTALIFIVLLITTNYSAYINIVKSYVFNEDMKKRETSIINSVEAAKISENLKTKKEARVKANEEHNITNSSKYSIKSLSADVNKSEYKLDIEITPYENRVIIPKIWKNVPLLDIQNKAIAWPKELENIFMKELENGVIRYPWSTKPWNNGNTFIFWHSSNYPWVKWDYNDVFALLDKVTHNDEVIVYYNQKKYKYKITEKKVITPWDVEILKRDNNKDEITIMTCRPIWTTLNRLIVIWEIVEEVKNDI